MTTFESIKWMRVRNENHARENLNFNSIHSKHLRRQTFETDSDGNIINFSLVNSENSDCYKQL